MFSGAGACFFQELEHVFFRMFQELEHVFFKSWSTFSGSGNSFSQYLEHVCSGVCVSGAGLFLLCLTKNKIYKSIMIKN